MPTRSAFGLVSAREVDLHLRRQLLGDRDRADIGVARAVRVLMRRGSNRADHRQHHQRRHLLLGLDGAHEVILRDVRDLVCDDGSEFVLVPRHRDQADVDTDETAGERERIDLAVVHDEERERLVGLRAVRDEAVAKRVQIVGDQLVVEHELLIAQLVQHVEAVLALLLGRRDGSGRTADVGQRRIVGVRDAGQYGDAGERQRREGGSGNHGGLAVGMLRMTTIAQAGFRIQRRTPHRAPALRRR